MSTCSGRSASLRLNGADPFRTDEGNYVLDLHLRRNRQPARAIVAGAEPDPRRGRERPLSDICDVLVIGQMPTARSRCATSTTATVNMSASTSPTPRTSSPTGAE